jgi:prolyl oligopeptidase
MKRGDSYYYFYNSGLQPQSVLYKQRTLESEAVAFLDPNTLSADGTISLSSFQFSESGKYLAYALSESGSDWVKIYVKETQTGNLIESKPLEWYPCLIKG